jgi:CopA family copper-resistance protein
MKRVFLLLILLLSRLFVSGQVKESWTCPMHPQVVRNAPGNCPICGMALVKKTVRAAPKKTTQKKPAVTKPKTGPVVNKPVTVDGNKKDTVPTTPGDKENHGVHDHHADSLIGMPGGGRISNQVRMEPGKTVRYDLYVKDTLVNYTGKTRKAIAINGSIPAPSLVFTEGDSAVIYLHNQLDEETSLHWHGVILPNQADGVPFLTTKRIGPGESHLYTFRVVQNGTYWYHSHSALQEQSGMYGALLFKTREEAMAEDRADTSAATSINNTLYNKEYTVVLSEWTDDDPMQVQRRLRTANDWFAIQKGSTQSYAEAIREGHFKTKLENEWKRMKAMDVSDVYYHKFLVNGQPEFFAPGFSAGDRVRLKIVNAGASSYFWLGYGGGKLTVIGNDGNDMVPVEVDRLILAPAETVDVVISIPEAMSYEFRATAEDRTGFSSLWMGSGHNMPAPTLPRLKYFEGMKMMNDMMHLDGTMDDMGMKMSNQTMDMNMVMYPELEEQDPELDSSMQMDHSGHHASSAEGNGIVTLNYDMLRSPVKTSLPDSLVRTLHFTLTGNMNRYVWTLDNKTVTESDRILVSRGEVLRLILTNHSMMRHPMHLHGHDFRVVNSHRDYSPLKNVIDVMPMETDTIEFAANQSGNWFFHCHILYHMMAGMGRVFTYRDSPVNPELPDAEEAFRRFRRHPDQRMMHLMVKAGIETNGSDGESMLSGNRYALHGIWHIGYTRHHGYEGELNLGRYLGVNQWWFPYIGFDYHYQQEMPENGNDPEKNMFGQVSNKSDRKTFVVGVQYTLPWLIQADARVDGDGKFRFQLGREDIPVTKRLRLHLMGNTDREYAIGIRYIVSKWFALSSHYDSDMGLGAGVTLSY